MAASSATVVGVFPDHAQADRAARELHRLGFTAREVGVIVRDRQGPGGAGPGRGYDVEEGAINGAVTGTIAGGVLGAVGSLLVPGIGPVLATALIGGLLAGATAGAAAGGVLGALIGLGVPEEEARAYERELAAGHTLVAVTAGDRAAEVRVLLRRYGAADLVVPIKGAQA